MSTSPVSERVDDIYSVIHRRRDVRTGFTGEPIAPAILDRILRAGHAAPSVGLSQPWDFVIITDPAIRTAFHAHVMDERDAFAAELAPDRRARFTPIRIEGILDATTSIVVTYDPDRAAPAVLGRRTIPDTGRFSVCLAIQNLWLAATAEGLGVGWVSFYRPEVLAELLRLPVAIEPLAWLCVGPVTHLESTPDLERLGWRAGVDLARVLHHDTW